MNVSRNISDQFIGFDSYAPADDTRRASARAPSLA